jgi:hypothetical protein
MDKIDMHESDEDKKFLDMWLYFSARADHSANALRAILFASANTGILAIGAAAVNVVDNPKVDVSCWVVLAAFVSFVLFLMALIQIIHSWETQKDKAIERRKLVASHSKLLFLRTLEVEIMKPTKRVGSPQSVAANYRNNSLDKKNSEIDCDAIWLLSLAYLSLGLSILIFTIDNKLAA